MKDRYDGIKGKEEGRANKLQKMFESEHNESNSFVKKNEVMQATLGGKMPNLEGRYQMFDSCMTNNGEHAQEFGRSLTAGIDKKAFPVK